MSEENKITGTIVAKGDGKEGQGANGPWRVQTYILETTGDYPKKVAFDCWNDKIESFGIRSGDTVTVSFNPESREYTGRWYTNLRAWKCSGGSGVKQDAIARAAVQPTNAATHAQDFDEDLPF